MLYIQGIVEKERMLPLPSLFQTKVDDLPFVLMNDSVLKQLFLVVCISKRAGLLNGPMSLKKL